MKRPFILTITAFAMASAVFAQTEQKDAAWAEKAAEKALKAQKAAELKAFKEAQKAELAAFIEAQKYGQPAPKPGEFTIEKPELAEGGDSAAYLFGVAQANGLDKYATKNLGVDVEYFDKFAEGIIARANIAPEDKGAAAYSAGQQVGEQVIKMADSFQKDYYEADPDRKIDTKIVANGLVAGLLGKSEQTPEAAGEQLTSLMEERRAANKERLYSSNRKDGQKWLEENKTKPGVVTLPSGLQYKILTAGTGDTPQSTDKVTVDYEGRLIDGTVFDSSYKRGKPSTFGVTQVIKGWTEALQLMTVGSKWELYIPYQLAYGDRATGKEIKPYSALIFIVELKGIEK